MVIGALNFHCFNKPYDLSGLFGGRILISADMKYAGAGESNNFSRWSVDIGYCPNDWIGGLLIIGQFNETFQANWQNAINTVFQCSPWLLQWTVIGLWSDTTIDEVQVSIDRRL